MGFFKKLFEAFGFSNQKCNILVVGLDDAGKTTILNQIMPKKHQYSEVVPTVGFKVEQFTKNNINFTMFDMSGASTHRDLWTAYYTEAQAIIYVIDCKDKLRVCVAKKELDDMLVHADLKDKRIPFLFFANKMDIAGCLSPFECCTSLGLDDIKTKPWHITHCCGLTGEGVEAGLSWLVEKLSRS